MPKTRPMPKPLSIDELVIDADTQSRVSINQEVVDDYAELIAAGNGQWPLGDLDVFHDGNRYMVSDGFHRTLAAKQAKRASIPCRVHKGTAVDARIFGMTANDTHGLRMTRADKRACVDWLLDNGKAIGGGKLTQEEIAEKSGVSRRFVQQIVAERKKAHNAHSSNAGNDGNSGNEAEPGPSTPPESGTATDESPSEDLGDCPNCGNDTWRNGEYGHACSKCGHPHGEPVGDADEDQEELKPKPDLPAKVKPAAEVGKRLGGIINGVSKLVNEAIELAGKPGGEFIQATQLKLDCTQLTAVLKAGRFKRVCRSCNGKGKCKYCTGRGWVTYEQWDGQKGKN